MDPDPLRGHHHVGEAVIDSERIAESEIVSRAYIIPLDDDRAVERFRIRRTPNEDARFVRRGGRRLHRPASILSERSDRSEPQGLASDEVLFLHVAEGADVPVGGAQGPFVPAAANWAGDGGAGCPKDALARGRRKTSHARGGHRAVESCGCSSYQRPSRRHCLPPFFVRLLPRAARAAGAPSKRRPIRLGLRSRRAEWDIISCISARSPWSSSVARSRKDSGVFSTSALAVVRLTTRSNLVGCSAGIAPVFVPRRILST